MIGTEFARVSGSYNTAYICTYQVIEQNTSGNYTVFRLYGYFYYGGGTQVSSGTGNGFYLDGTYIYSGNYTFGPGAHLLGTKDIVVGHNNDGTYPGRYVGISASSWHMSGATGGNIYAGNIARYATITNAPSTLTDEGSFWFSYSNPANSSMSCWIEVSPVGEHLCERQLSGTSGTYTWELTENEREQIRAKMPNTNSAICRLGLYSTIGGSTNASYVDKTLTIVNANPIFNNFVFEDTNTVTLALTGNNQNIIQGYSNVKATIPVEFIAEAQKSASMVKYSFTCSDDQRDITYSSDSSTNNTIENVKSGVFNVYAIDSRNNSTLVTKNANQTIAYNPLTKGNITVTRQNGSSEQTTLTLNGKADLVDFGDVINSIQEAKFRYKITDSSAWSNYNNITLTVDNDGNYSFNGLIQGDTNNGFDIEHSYNIEVVISDELSSVTFTANLGSGIPNIALHKNGVGIMGKYDTSVGGLLQVGGANIITDFSTNEVKLPIKWIDGKPIYRKVFSVNSIGSSVTATIGTINNLDTPLFIKGVSFYNIWTPIPRTHASNIIYQNQIYIENNTVKIGCGSGSAISKGFVIVEYTKTTDV